VRITTGTPRSNSTIEKKLVVLDVVAFVLVLSDALITKFAFNCNLLAPGALKLGAPKALSNKPSLLSAVTITSEVLKPTEILLGRLLYLVTITSCDGTLIKKPF